LEKMKVVSESSAKNTKTGPAETGSVATSAPTVGPNLSAMTVATLTNKAVTAIFNASSNQYANSGDTKCILGEGERFVGSLPARKSGFQHSLNSAPRYTGAAAKTDACPLYPESGRVQCKSQCPLWANSRH